MTLLDDETTTRETLDALRQQNVTALRWAFGGAYSSDENEPYLRDWLGLCWSDQWLGYHGPLPHSDALAKTCLHLLRQLVPECIGVLEVYGYAVLDLTTGTVFLEISWDEGDTFAPLVKHAYSVAPQSLLDAMTRILGDSQ